MCASLQPQTMTEARPILQMDLSALPMQRLTVYPNPRTTALSIQMATLLPVSEIPESVPECEIPEYVPVRKIPESIKIREIPDFVPECELPEHICICILFYHDWKWLSDQ